MTGSALGAQSAAKLPRYRPCDKASNWLPTDYDGGCSLRFGMDVRGIAYKAFKKAAETNDQWTGKKNPPSMFDVLSSMECARGGVAGRVKLNRHHAGICTWRETFGHHGISDHPDHDWPCTVSVVLRAVMTGRSRLEDGRTWMQWEITGAPLDDATRMPGEFPKCDKDPSTDNWHAG